MSALDVFAPFGVGDTSRVATSVPTDAWDIMSEGAVSTALPTALGSIWDENSISQRNTQIQNKLGKSIYDLTGMPESPEPKLKDAIDSARNKKLNDMILEGRKNNPQLWDGIKTDDEAYKEVSELGKVQEGEFQKTLSNASSDVSMYGGLAGTMASSIFTDPINLVTLPFGAASSVGVLKAIAFESLLNMGIETVETPMFKKWADRVGREYGIGDAATDILTAGAVSGGLTAAIRGIKPAYRAVRGQSMNLLDKLSHVEKLPSNVRDALQYMSRKAHIDEEVPGYVGGRSFEGADLAEHRKSVDETYKAFQENREPLYSDRAKEMFAPLKEPKGTFKSSLNKPSDIINFIINQGGISKKEANIEDVRITGIGSDKKTGYFGQIITDKGKKLDDLREAAEEAGYLPPDSTVTDLLNAIDDTYKGDHVFSHYDAADVENWRGYSAANTGNQVFDSTIKDVYDILKNKGVVGTTEIDMRKIAEDHLNNPTRESTLEEDIVDYLEKKAVSDFSGVVSNLKKNGTYELMGGTEAATKKWNEMALEKIEQKTPTLDEMKAAAVETEKIDLTEAQEAEFADMMKNLTPEDEASRFMTGLREDLEELDRDAMEITAAKSCGVK